MNRNQAAVVQTVDRACELHDLPTYTELRDAARIIAEKVAELINGT